MKKIICGVLTLILIFSICSFSASAAVSTSFIIDNDSSDSACDTSHYGFDIYVTGSSHYNGDCRRGLTSNTSAWYSWINESKKISSTSPISVTAGYYINNSRFTDPAACYYIEQRDGGYLMARVNQNTAPVGWSYINYTVNKNYATPGGFSVYGMSLGTSGSGSGYTGADAIRVSATAN